MEQRQKERNGIAVAGSLNADIFYKTDTYPQEGLLTKIRETKGHVGGSGNLILDLAKLDPQLPVKAGAVVGCDEQGEMVLRMLSRYPNIDLRGIRREAETSVTIVMNAQDSKQRTFFYIPAANDRFDLSCIDWDCMEAEIFHLEYLLLMKAVDAPDAEYGTHGARILREARERGMETSIDVVSERGPGAAQIVASALRYTDYCSINEVEAEMATGIDLTSSDEALARHAGKALARLRELGVAKWAVIHAPACSYGHDCRNGEFYTVQSLKLPDGFIQGTNGAGDAYCSGILYAALRGDGLADAMRLAAACAACSLSEENGTDGMRAYEDVRKLAERFGGRC